MQVKWKVGSVWLDSPEEGEREHRRGAGARAAFRKREGGREMEGKGCQQLLALQESRKERR